jgi:hypothetical protein
MSALIGGVLVVLLAIVVGAMVMRGRRRSQPRNGIRRAEPAQGDDTAATGYVPGVWLLGGADSAAPGGHGHAHGHHHGADAGAAHAAGGDAGGGHAGGGDGGSGGGH